MNKLILVLILLLAVGFVWNGTVSSVVAPPSQPTVTITQAAVLGAIKVKNRQEFAEQPAQVILAASSAPQSEMLSWFRDDYQILMRGTVSANIDMSSLNENDVRVTESSVYLNLPPVRLSASVDLQNSVVMQNADRCVAVLCGQYDRLEMLKMSEPIAQEDMISQAEQIGIVERAEEEATKFYQDLLTSAGAERVVVTFSSRTIYR